MGKIRINNMSFNTYNGVFAEEKKLGQKIEVDCEMTYPIETKVRTDNLEETVSYADVYDTIAQFVTHHNYNLIESLANNLLHEILRTYPMLDNVRLRIRKYSVPIAGIFDNIEIEVQGANDHE
ncbi:dihydroneopterin aldolase [Limosilactobacillus albertensis]|uniref:7,8-dihydroneopterin aldolase n=1 Tax=Limosilactobacillus albertensis TaxID=2759752 RepID=A0A839H7Q9_9LACO|nr:dihydroneopterin aldolase [Limosilactobacillus albertensis]MBB1122617.1 dihydroneopterin aldolase [Limosilactobacillus albertensis]